MTAGGGGESGHVPLALGLCWSFIQQPWLLETRGKQLGHIYDYTPVMRY